jgi:HEAT repeats
MRPVVELTDKGLVLELGGRTRQGPAYRELLRRGLAALPAIRAGLHHPQAAVRAQCCRLLDQLLVADALPQLIAMLDDEDVGVRVTAVHALACDRCKQDSCRPSEASVLPAGLRLVEGDPNPHVRAMAIELVGRFVHGNPAAARTLLRAREADPSPTVRKKAGWYAPGGTIYRRTAPRPARRARRA